MVTENDILLRQLQDGEITLAEYIERKEKVYDTDLKAQFRALSDHLI